MSRSAQSRSPRMSWYLGFLLLAVAGCQNDPMVLNGKLDRSEKEKLALTEQNRDLQRRLDTAVKDNQQLHANLGLEQQQVAVSEKKLRLIDENLKETAQKLELARQQNQQNEEKIRNASMRRDGGVTIQPNTTALEEVRIAGVRSRRDGDVVRIELPCGELFGQDGVQIRPETVSWLCNVAADVARAYPDQRIGIEGNTDTAPPSRGTHQELSVARAMAVYNVLITRTRLQPNQLIVVGHGANNPIVSNGTPNGRARNNRIEFVVYPQRVTN
jgi:flagellar motor protein MotB